MHLPEWIGRTGAWCVRVGEASGRPEELLAVPGERGLVIIEGRVFLYGINAALSLSLEVPVTSGRVTEIHIPDYGLSKIASTLGLSSSQ